MNPLPELRLQPCNYTVSHYTGRGDSRNTFDLEAPYQRGSVWSIDQRRNLIKSLIMGLPVGTLIVSVLPFRGTGSHSWRVVDGKQRIQTVRAFVDDDAFAVPGWWFRPDDLNDPSLRAGDITYSQLAVGAQRGLQNRPLPSIEFKADIEYTDNPEYDPTLEVGTAEYKANPIRTRRYLTRTCSDAEILHAEADLYLLVNFGGVEQTDDDRARAAAIVGSPGPG